MKNKKAINIDKFGNPTYQKPTEKTPKNIDDYGNPVYNEKKRKDLNTDDYER